jgi:sugar lactone lactonase YvrE
MQGAKTTRVIIVTILLLSFLSVPAFAGASWLFSITNTEVPTRLAVDGKGNIYVTEPRTKNRVLVFNRQGNYIRTLGGLKGPIGIAVDAQSKLYIGNSGTGSVDVYGSDYKFLSRLGTGNGEFKLPSAVAVISTGRVYVVDTKANQVKAYNQDGTSAFTFGGSGSGDGKFNSPSDLAVDEAAGEIYVTDRGIFNDPTYGAMGGARVQVFRLDGTFLRSFGQFGSGPGQMKMPLGIAADGAGRLYITDSNLAAVHVFSTTGSWVETLDAGRSFKTPIGIAIGKDKRLFVASSNSPSIEVYALAGYTAMTVTPKTLNFAAVEGGTNPAPQTVSISNTGTGALDWTTASATTDGAAWLSATPSGSTAAGGTSGLSISVNSSTTRLRAGVYTGSVTVTASGAAETISVNLTISAPPAILSVVPATLSFKAQVSGPAPHPQTVSINNIGSGAMTWSASTGQQWLKLDASGSFLTVSANTGTFTAAGAQTGSVTISAPGAQASPQTVSVTVQLILAGSVKVTSNVTNAAFDISGPANYSGNGRTWSNDEVTPGEYTVTFKRVPGYIKPVARKFTVKTGRETTITADYRKKGVPTHIIAGTVSNANKDMQVSILPLDSTKAPRTFMPFTHADSIRVAAGDLDGSGYDSIVVTDYKRAVKVFTEQGSFLAGYELSEGSVRADVAVGDLDNDGKAEILVAAEQENQPRRVIKLLSYAANILQEKATVYTESREGRFSIALGDINDDAQPELFIADSSGVRAFTLKQTGASVAASQAWSRTADYRNEVQIAAGDMNGDGICEIAVSHEQEKEAKGREKEHASFITVLKGTGEDANMTIEPFTDLSYVKASTIAMGDLDADGVDELVVGAGPAESNDPIVRLFETDGSYAGVTMKPMNGKFGLNVGLGMFQQ